MKKAFNSPGAEYFTLPKATSRIRFCLLLALVMASGVINSAQAKSLPIFSPLLNPYSHRVEFFKSQFALENFRDCLEDDVPFNGPGCNCIAGQNVWVFGQVVTFISQTNIDEYQNGGILCISGTLVIDRVQVFRGTTFKMAPGSSIHILNNAHLGLYQFTNLDACGNQMWQGIYVEGSILLHKTSISNAFYAVEAAPNAWIRTVFNCTFNRNYCSIYAPNSTNFWGQISSCTFDCSANLMPPGPNAPSVLSFGPKSWAGIYIRESVLIISSRNDFTRLHNGILAESGCILSVNKNHFNNLDGASYYGGSNGNTDFRLIKGNGIVISNSDGKFYYNSFDSPLSSGITASKSDLTAIGNNLNINFGISFVESSAKRTLIQSNSINYINGGIFGYEVESPRQLEISANALYGEDTNNQFPGTYVSSNTGIEILNTKQSGGGIITGHTNFSIDKNSYGIRLSNYGDMEISNNNISVRSNFYNSNSTGKSGILLSASPGNFLVGNSVLTTSNLGGIIHHGIINSWSKNNVFCCNATLRSSYGAYFTGDADETHLLGTDFHQNPIASLYVDGYCSEQHHYANFWPGLTAPIEATHVGTEFDVRRSKFFVRNDDPNFLPNPIQTPLTNEPWFEPRDGNESRCIVVCDSFIRARNMLVPPSGPRITGTDLNIAHPDADFGDYQDGRSWNSRIWLYHKLSSWPELLGQETLIDSFYYATEGSPMDTYYQMRRSLRTLYDPPVQQKSLLDSFNEGIDNIVLQLNELDSLLQLDGADTLALENLILQRLQAADSIRLLYVSVTADLDSIYRSAAQSLKDEWLTIPANTYEQQLEKNISLLYLKYIIEGIDSLSQSDWQSINTIANQCPKTQDYAVFNARGLYQLHDPQMEYDDALLCSSPLPLISSTATEEQELMVVHPNPADQSILLSSTFDMLGKRLRLLSSDGRVIQSQIFLKSAYDTDVQTGLLNPGLYLIQILDDRSVISSFKIIIAH